ncbi:MAG TPA: protein kinase [Anaerolineae bacterium]|nr:protein kinase [Anaerolineae bacterium]
MIGATIQNRYRIETELGQGGMGVVYRAHDELLDRAVAVKLLSETRLGTDGRARLLREAQAAARLNHPNIVTVHDAGETDPATPGASGVPFIVMELVEGESLYSRRPATIGELLVIARQVCDALDHAHAQGIVHRDIKPENILVIEPAGMAVELPSQPVRVKLMDFGLARSGASRLTAEGALVGTVFYLAPEQALGQAIDGRTDLYALGVVLYELSAGRLPFTGDDPLTIISQHLHAPPVPPSTYNPEIPPALDALILRLLSKRPDDRPASAAEVRQALDSGDSASTSIPTLLLDRIVRGRLVARERELTEARALWQKALSGESSVLLVSGEPGIGKTRLARELADRAQVSGATVLLGECYAEGGAPYAPIAHIIQNIVDLPSLGDLAGLSPSVLADLITLTPDLALRYPDVPPNPPLDPQADQQRLFESVVKLCAALAARAPVLLALDDAHWADGGTLILLRHLARRAARLKLRVLLMLTYREVELDEARALNEVLLDLNRERLATRVKLGRLTLEQTRDLLAAMFAEDITPEFLDGIYRETEGNPFFIEEVCKALIEDGKLYHADGRWRRPSMDEIQVPQSVRVTIQARIAKLPTLAQDVLRLAAIFGREFDFDVLNQASDATDDALIDALESAERAQLIGEVRRPGSPRTTFAFAHALVPAALRESISSLRRQRLHRRVAAAIQALRPDDYEVLAYHFDQAGAEEQSRRYYVHAGDRARRLVALQDALRHYTAALERCPETESAERAELLHKLGECQWITFDTRGALATLESAYTAFEALGTRVKAGEMQRMIGRLYWELADRRAALEHYQHALAILEQGPETAELAWAFSSIAQMHMLAADFDQAIAWGERALALAERLGAEQVVMHALNNIGSARIQVYDRDPERGAAMLQDSWRRALALGMPHDACRAANNRGEALIGLCRYEEARQTFEELLAYATRVQALPFAGVAYRHLLELDWLAGQWSAALARWPQLTEFTLGSWSIWSAETSARLNNDLGRPEAARQELEQTLPQAMQWDEIQTIVPHLHQLARAYAALGLQTETAQALNKYLDRIDRNPYLEWQCGAAILFACQWFAAQTTPDALDAARACLPRLERADRQWRILKTDTMLAQGHGVVAHAEGNPVEAAEYYRRAAQGWAKLNRPFDQARALGSLGQARAAAGQSSPAREAFDQALGVYDALAAQIEDVELKASFLRSQPVRMVREARG